MKKHLWILELLAIVAIFGAGIMALNAAEATDPSPQHAAAKQSAADSPASRAGACDASLDAKELVLAEKTEDGGCPYMKAKAEGKADCPHKAKGADCDCPNKSGEDCQSCAKAKSGDCPHKAKDTEKQSES